MKKIELKGLKQDLYYEKLSNGLEVYFVPYANKMNYSMHYVTRFGSVDTSFVPVGSNREIKVPDGIAHFLEHKMFESEDGVDPFTFASKSGTDCNASTSFHCTRYLFQGNQNFYENLDYLLTYVHSPYFTDENVEKEKGIIAEELRQYQDMVDCVMDDVVREGIFAQDPVRVDIGGTVDSIQKITKEDLDITYRTFYQPSNMFLVATGNFEPEKAIEIVRSNKALNQAVTNIPIARSRISEPTEVHQEIQELKFNTNTTKLACSLKISLEEDQTKGDGLYQVNLYLSVILTVLFGLASDFRERNRRANRYTSLYYSKDISNHIIYVTFYAETEEPEALIDEIKKELNHIDISERDFKRTLKVWLASEVMMIDNIDITLDNIVYELIEYGHIIPNKLEIYKSLSYDKMKEVISKLDFSNICSVIVRPKN